MMIKCQKCGEIYRPSLGLKFIDHGYFFYCETCENLPIEKQEYKCHTCGEEVKRKDEYLKTFDNNLDKTYLHHKSCYDKSIENKFVAENLVKEITSEGHIRTTITIPEVAPQAEPEVAPQEGKGGIIRSGKVATIFDDMESGEQVFPVKPTEPEEKKESEEEDYDPYCSVCGTCGYVGCCGVENWLDKHVKGKTNCMHEESMIEEIKDLYEPEDEEVEPEESEVEVIEEIAVEVDSNGWQIIDARDSKMNEVIRLCNRLAKEIKLNGRTR